MLGTGSQRREVGTDCEGVVGKREGGETGKDASPLLGFCEKVCVHNSHELKKRENLSGNNRNYLLDFLG